MEDFILLFPRVPCHLKYFEITNETNSIMHGFIMEFHNVKIYFVSLVGYAMKWNLLPPMLVSMGFIFLETVYTKFHLDETTLLSFFINSMSCHQNFLCDNSFNKNKTPIRSSLTRQWDCFYSPDKGVYHTSLFSSFYFQNRSLSSFMRYMSAPILSLFCGRCTSRCKE